MSFEETLDLTNSACGSFILPLAEFFSTEQGLWIFSPYNLQYIGFASGKEFRSDTVYQDQGSIILFVLKNGFIIN